MQRAADLTSHHIHSLPKTDGLAPLFISTSTGKFQSGAPLSVGASADSYYEYLLKQWIQTGKTQQWLTSCIHAFVCLVLVMLLEYC